MRRLVSIAALGLSLAVPVWAQRGGGHGAVGGGMRGGGFSGHAGGFAARAGSVNFGGGHSFGGVHSAGVRPGPGFSRGVNRSFNRGFTRGSFRDRGFRDRGFRAHRRRDFDFDDFGFNNNCFGFACRNWGWNSPWWGWGGWGWYDPWVWSSWEDEDRRFDEDYYRQYEMADRWNQRNLEEQRMLRQEEEEGDQDAYAPRSSARRSAPVSEAQPEPAAPATVLVFRDQHREEVSNYAIVGQTLMSFSAQKTKKIPLSDLDVAATQKANDDRGVSFRVPGVNEGQ